MIAVLELRSYLVEAAWLARPASGVFHRCDQETLVEIDANVLHGALLSVAADSAGESERN